MAASVSEDFSSSNNEEPFSEDSSNGGGVDDDDDDDDERNWNTRDDSRGKGRDNRRRGSYVAERWTYEDLERLKENVELFLKEEKTELSEVLDGSKVYRIRNNFYRRVARGIKRPLFSVYRKVRREFHAKNFVGPWNHEQELQLLSEYSRHGRNWAKIGHNLEMSARAVRDKYKNFTGRDRIGSWLPDEESRLKASIIKVHGANGELEDLAYHGEWNKIAKYVKTRNSSQCRRKWFFHRGGRRAALVERQWTGQDELQLIDKLLLDEAEEEDGIDWVGMCSNWEHARSHGYLKHKWLCLKRRVPGYHFKSFQDNLDYIVEHVRPVIVKKIKAGEIESSSDDDDDDQEQEQQTIIMDK